MFVEGKILPMHFPDKIRGNVKNDQKLSHSLIKVGFVSQFVYQMKKGVTNFLRNSLIICGPSRA